jgi:predicted Rossmann fold nucleotide-binding protein DprA/Smf involved in DNA uptake
MPEAIGASQFMLLLHSVPQVGEKTLARLLRLLAQQRTTPEAFLALPEQELCTRYDLDARVAAFLVEKREALRTQSAELARILRAHPFHLLTLESATYPARLEHNDDASPPILYALGNATLLSAPQPPPNTSFTFTIAVSNGATPAILARQDEIATALVAAGGAPVTGHDRQPFKRLALAAQRRNRPILYVFDRGLREALGPEFDRPPFAAARIRDAVFETGRDLAVSPFRLDDHGLGANNRRRDRLVFALSDLIIALDVRAGGGMDAECRRAHEQGRPVFVAEGGRSGNDVLRTIGCSSLPTNPADMLKNLFP